MERKINFLKGVFLSSVVGLGGILLSKMVPKNLISGSVFALLIGMLVNSLIKSDNNAENNIGLVFMSKRVLKLSIVLMGFNLNIKDILNVGKYSLFVMVFTLFTAFFFGYYIGKIFKMNWKLSSLIAAGTGICGGSAIASIAPIIEAESSDIAYSISATFLFDILMVVLFPIAGKYFSMSDLGYGLWAGTAVNDTSSVVAAGYAFSDAAGNFALIVKLTRTLSIVPVVIIFSYINSKVENGKIRDRVDVKNIFPWFIIAFIITVLINSIGLVPLVVGQSLASLSKYLMILSLGAIGLTTNFKEISKSGLLPMIHGFIISLLVVVVSFVVQIYIGKI